MAINQPQAGDRLFAEAGPLDPIKELTLPDLMIRQLLDWLLAGITELEGKGKGTKKVIPCTMALLAKPPFLLLAKVVEGLIKEAYYHTQLLSKNFAENWNHGYS